MLGDDEFRRALDDFSGRELFGRRRRFRTVDEHDDVRVLLDGARFTEIGKLRLLGLNTTELRKRDNGNVELLRHNFEIARDGRDFLLTVLRTREFGIPARHQLDIVDHDHVHAPRHRAQTAAFGQNLSRGHPGRIVDINFALFELVARQHELFPFRRGELSGQSLGHADVSIRTEQSLYDLNARHFQREHGADLVFAERRMLDEVHGERSFSHTGTGGEDDEIGGL